MDLAAVQFNGQGTAVERYAAAKERSGDASWTRKVGFVERHSNGHLLIRGVFAGHYVDVDESDHVSQVGGGEGAVAGGLIGVLAGPPGIAVGLLAGAVIGSDHGPTTDTEREPDALADQLRAVVPPSTSAIVAIGSAPEIDGMLASVSDGAQSVTRRTLSEQDQKALEEALDTAPSV
jgi:uncharacterized membrane protein